MFTYSPYTVYSTRDRCTRHGVSASCAVGVYQQLDLNFHGNARPEMSPQIGKRGIMGLWGEPGEGSGEKRTVISLKGVVN